MARLVDYGWPGISRAAQLDRAPADPARGHEGAPAIAGEFNVAPASAGTATPTVAAANPLVSLARSSAATRAGVDATGWNKAAAARVLEVDIKTLNKKIRDFSSPPVTGRTPLREILPSPVGCRFAQLVRFVRLSAPGYGTRLACRRL